MISKELRENLPYLADEIIAYIEATYGEHYAEDEIQTIDFIEALGNAQTTFRDKALKYLSRYGKKDGKNKKDLLKAIHYILMIYQMDHPVSKSR